MDILRVYMYKLSTSDIYIPPTNVRGQNRYSVRMLMDIPYILYGRGSAPVRKISIDVEHTHILCNSTIVQRENKGVQCPALPLRNAIGTGALERHVSRARVRIRG